MLNALTIDVEDWYQSSYDTNASISKLCVLNTQKVLKFLSSHNVKATFFVQGMVAKQYPDLIKEIRRDGHEIQSHGYSHLPVNKMSPKEFKNELQKTQKCLEDLIGEPVFGFRAPDFSIDRDSFWAFEVMVECGIRYDSSIFPVKMARYGINGFAMGYSIIKTSSGVVEELPVSIYQMRWLKRVKIPIGGGGYFRLFPYWFLRYCLEGFDEDGSPFVIYCHPYEFNPQEWRQTLKYVPRYQRLHQGVGRKGFERKVSQLLQLKNFGTMSEVMEILRNKIRT